MQNNLGILGIAKKAGFVELGEEQVAIVVRSGKARLILAASDASEHTLRRVQTLLERSKAPYVQLDADKDELGSVFGKGAVAVLAITDIGLSESFIAKLEAGSPGKYTEMLELLRQRADKARRRKKEAEAHERNKRTGKKGGN